MSCVALLRRLIKSHPLIVFAKSYCPYSQAAKATLHKYVSDSELFCVDIDIEFPDPAVLGQFQDDLQRLVGERTVPQIFCGGKYLGDSQALTALDEAGELKQKLIAAVRQRS